MGTLENNSTANLIDNQIDMLKRFKQIYPNQSIDLHAFVETFYSWADDDPLAPFEEAELNWDHAFQCLGLYHYMCHHHSI